MGRISANEQTPLWSAADNGHLQTARRLLEAGVEVDRAETAMGITPLIKASFKGFADLVALLLDRGADVNKQRHSGTTALFSAAQNGHLEAARVLLEHKADTELCDQGGAPLLIASYAGKLAIVRLLLAHGADKDKEAAGRTALGWAEHFAHVEVAALLREHGAT